MLRDRSGGTGTIRQRIAASRTRLYRVALAWCGDPMLADDLVQETLATGITRQRQLRDQKSLFPWLYSILNNAWRSHIRKQKPQYQLDDTIPTGDSGPCDSCAAIELVAQVRSAVATLPEIERQVISLVDLDELSYCEVAGILDIPIGTAMSRLHRARKHLLERIEQPAGTGHTRKGHLHLVE